MHVQDNYLHVICVHYCVFLEKSLIYGNKYVLQFQFKIISGNEVKKQFLIRSSRIRMCDAVIRSFSLSLRVLIFCQQLYSSSHKESQWGTQWEKLHCSHLQHSPPRFSTRTSTCNLHPLTSTISAQLALALLGLPGNDVILLSFDYLSLTDFPSKYMSELKKLYCF